MSDAVAESETGEVTGTVRWVDTPDEDGIGIIRISGSDYPIRAVENKDGHSITLGERGYRLIGTPGGWTCSCPDFIYRRQGTVKGCKHTGAVRVAMRVLNRTTKRGSKNGEVAEAPEGPEQHLGLPAMPEDDRERFDD